VRPARRAWLLAAALVIQLLVTVGAHPAAAVTAQTDTSATTADLSPEAAASKKAAQTGSPVEVGEETTPTQLVTAQGEMEISVYCAECLKPSAMSTRSDSLKFDPIIRRVGRSRGL
jgi:hypothetical protein